MTAAVCVIGVHPDGTPSGCGASYPLGEPRCPRCGNTVWRPDPPYPDVVAPESVLAAEPDVPDVAVTPEPDAAAEAVSAPKGG